MPHQLWEKIVQTIVDLRNLVNHEEQDSVWVRGVNDFYVYNKSSAAADDGNLVIRPNNLAPAETGRWIRQVADPGDINASLTPTAGAVPLGDGNGKIDPGWLKPVQRALFMADQFENPVNADWAVNALAPLAAGSINAGLLQRLFDDTTEEGVGFSARVPEGATQLILRFFSRAEVAPGTPKKVAPKLYFRGLADNAAPSAWSAGTLLTELDMPASTTWQEDSQTISLATLGLVVGRLYQFELTRVVAALDNLVNDWNLLYTVVEFN